MGINWRITSRKWHRWGAAVVALPFLIVIVTGLLLLWKKDVAWIQPPTQNGTGTELALSFEQILAASRSVPEAEIRSWDDVDRLDVRPGKGVVKVRANNQWEVQLDLQTGEVLQVMYRRSDLIEALHDGSWFFDAAKLWIFFPVALIVLVLWLTGVYLFILPYPLKWARARAKRRGPPARVVGTRAVRADLPHAPPVESEPPA